MRKLIVTVLAIFASQAAYALPVGNPTEASLFLNGAWWEGSCCDPCDPCFTWCDSWNIRGGFYGDYVFNIPMEVKQDGRSDIDTTSINTSAGYLVLNICDRIDIFGTLGTSKIHIRTDAQSFGASSSLESELSFETYLSWSAGGRVTLLEWNCLGIGVEGQYFQTSPEITYFLDYDTGALTYFNDSADTTYREWQAGLGVSYRFATRCPTIAFVPYAAVKWSEAKLLMDNFTFTAQEELVIGDFKSTKLWGYAVGMSLTLCDMIGVTVEGRWADEKAIYVNGQARF